MTATDNTMQYEAALQSAWPGSSLQVSHLNGAIGSNNILPAFDNASNHEDIWSDSYLQAASDAMLQQQHTSAQFGEGIPLNGFKRVSTAAPTSTMSTEMESMDWSQLSTSPQQLSHAWPSHSLDDHSSITEAKAQSILQSDAEGPQSRLSGSTHTPARSQTESLWQRRLNAKNKELQQLNQRMSASDSSPQIARSSSPRPHQRQRHASDDDKMTRLSEHEPESSLGSEIASGDNLSAAQSNGLSLSLGSVNPLNMVSMPSAQQHRHSAFSNQPNSPDVGLVSAVQHAQQLPHAAMRHSSSSNDELRSSPSSLPSWSHHSAHACPSNVPVDGNSVEGFSSFADSGTLPPLQRSRRSRGRSSSSSSSKGSSTTLHHASSTNSKGVIDKVIIPPAPGAQSDAVDIHTGETGQMRHVCPFEGCDKHFSTSGHARRHSRIHDCLRPFVCPHDECHATFTRRDNCTQHQRARHKYQLLAHRLDEGEK